MIHSYDEGENWVVDGFFKLAFSKEELESFFKDENYDDDSIAGSLMKFYLEFYAYMEKRSDVGVGIPFEFPTSLRQRLLNRREYKEK